MIMRYESFLCFRAFPQCSLVPKRLTGRTSDQEREEGAADVDDDEDEEDKYSDDETEDDEDNADVWRWSPGRPLGPEGSLVDVPVVVPRGHRAEPLWARSSFQVATVVILRGTPRLARGVLGARRGSCMPKSTRWVRVPQRIVEKTVELVAAEGAYR